MTTIIITEDMYGWDSSLLIGTQQHTCPFPKVFVDAHGVWAFAGSPSMAMRGIRAIIEEEEFADITGFMESAVGQDNNFEIVRMWIDEDEKKRIRCWSCADMYGYTPPLPMVLGTGGEIALGAYYASDGNVNVAMRVATDHDGNSMGPAQVENSLDLYERHVILHKRKKEAAKA